MALPIQGGPSLNCPPPPKKNRFYNCTWDSGMRCRPSFKVIQMVKCVMACPRQGSSSQHGSSHFPSQICCHNITNATPEATSRSPVQKTTSATFGPTSYCQPNNVLKQSLSLSGGREGGRGLGGGPSLRKQRNHCRALLYCTVLYCAVLCWGGHTHSMRTLGCFVCGVPKRCPVEAHVVGVATTIRPGYGHHSVGHPSVFAEVVGH